MKDEELVCFKTDKTGYLALDTQENFTKKMEKHIENDKIIDEKEVKTIENKLNKHTEHFLNITKAGENTNQTKRIKGNLKTVDNQIPVLSGSSKDHKELKEEETSPDLRPIMGAMVGPNIGIATIASVVIKTIAEEADTGLVSKSTEETINKIEVYNDKRKEINEEDDEIVVGSMDIEKWYPNTMAVPSAKEIRTMVEESDLEFKGIDYDVVSRYLGEFLTIEEIVEEKMEEILYIKKEETRKKKKSNKGAIKNVAKKNCSKKNVNKAKKKTLDIKKDGGGVNKAKKETLDIQIDGGGVNKNKNGNKKEDKFFKPKRKPTKVEGRKMLGKAL